MSWVVEQSEKTSTVNVNGDTITCNTTGHDPINVLYKDPADKNGQYFWEINVQEVEERGCVSVGLTTDQGFKSGWGLKAMKYLGNLSDGSCLLVQSFGDRIKQGDKVGILLQLTDSDMKMYLFHNDRPLGLAFHLKSPYPKPLYPVVSFDSSGKIKISRSQNIPSGLNRTAPQYQGIEGNWKIIDFPQHPKCNGCQLEIERNDGSQTMYRVHAHVANSLNCQLEYNSSSHECKTSGCMSTMMMGSPEEMEKEAIISNLMGGIQRLDVQGQEKLTIQTSNVGQVQLERFTKAAPSAVTENIFN